MDCFSSADPAAVNSTLLYDHNNDVDNLWFRNDTAGPLESCFPPRPRQFQCTVCLHDRTVYAMCEKLQDGVRMMMEAGGDSVNIYKSDCPAPPAPPPEDTQQWLPPVMIAFIVMIILIFFFIYKRWKRSGVEQTRAAALNPDESSTSSGNAEAKPGEEGDGLC